MGKKKPNMKMLMIIIGIIIIIGTVVFFILKSNQPKDEIKKQSDIFSKQLQGDIPKNSNKIEELKGKVKVGDTITIGTGNKQERVIITDIIDNIPIISPKLKNSHKSGTTITINTTPTATTPAATTPAATTPAATTPAATTPAATTPAATTPVATTPAATTPAATTPAATTPAATTPAATTPAATTPAATTPAATTPAATTPAATTPAATTPAATTPAATTPAATTPAATTPAATTPAATWQNSSGEKYSIVDGKYCPDNKRIPKDHCCPKPSGRDNDEYWKKAENYNDFKDQIDNKQFSCANYNTMSDNDQCAWDKNNWVYGTKSYGELNKLHLCIKDPLNADKCPSNYPFRTQLSEHSPDNYKYCYKTQECANGTSFNRFTGSNCNHGGDYTSHGTVSESECRQKCREDNNCITYASKPNEWCTTYRTCVKQTGTQWGGIFKDKVPCGNSNMRTDQYSDLPSNWPPTENYNYIEDYSRLPPGV